MENAKRKVILEYPHDGTRDSFIVRREEGNMNFEIEKMYSILIDNHFLLVTREGDKTLGVVDADKPEEMRKRLYQSARDAALEILEYHNGWIPDEQLRYVFEDRTNVRESLL